MLGKKILVWEKKLVRKIFGLKKNFGPQKNSWSKKLLVQKNFAQKIFLGQKNISSLDFF